MKQLSRRLLDCLTACSLLLAVALAAVWLVRALPGTWQNSLWVRTLASPRLVVAVDAGSDYIWIETRRTNRALTTDVPDGSILSSQDSELRGPRFLFKSQYGAYVRRLPDGRISFESEESVAIPYGDAVFLFLLLPFLRWGLPPLLRWGRSAYRRLRARFATPPGCCQACGYDLRASPDRCPECGTTSTAVFVA